MVGGEARGWCILRCSGRNTLALAASLAAAGFEAWTPAEVQHVRVGRDRERTTRQVSAFPSFVFVGRHHVDDLARIRMLPMSPHPGFSIFSHAGRVPVISTAEIERLQRDEMVRRGETPGKARPRPLIGAEYRPDAGPYAGLPGVVWSVEGDAAIVSFGGWMDHVKVDAWIVPQVVLPTDGR